MILLRIAFFKSKQVLLYSLENEFFYVFAKNVYHSNLDYIFPITFVAILRTELTSFAYFISSMATTIFKGDNHAISIWYRKATYDHTEEYTYACLGFVFRPLLYMQISNQT